MRRVGVGKSSRERGPRWKDLEEQGMVELFSYLDVWLQTNWEDAVFVILNNYSVGFCLEDPMLTIYGVPQSQRDHGLLGTDGSLRVHSDE